MCDPEVVEVADRLDDTPRSGIPDVVVADRDDVDARVGQTLEQRRVEGEREPVGCQRNASLAGSLEIDDSEIRFAEQPTNGFREGRPPNRGQRLATDVQQRRPVIAAEPPSHG
jgi:hypothetical protein